MLFSIRTLPFVLLILFSVACASTASAKPLSQKVGERVTHGVVDESLSSLDTAENRQHIGNLIGSPEMTRAAHALSASIAAGVIDGVSESALRDVDASQVGPSIERNLDEHITPALRRMTSKVVGAAVAASLSEANRGHVGDLTEEAAQRAVKGLATGIEEDLGPALAVTLERDLGPAIAVLLERDILPAVGRGLAGEEMQGAIRAVSASVAGGAVIASEEALDEIQEENAALGEDSSLEIFGTSVAVGFAVSVVIAVVFAAGFVFVLIALVRTRRRMRDFETSSRRTEKLVELLASRHDIDELDLG